MLLKCFLSPLGSILFLILFYILSSVCLPKLVNATPITNAFINEIHYDNNGVDVNEQVEIAGDANLDLTGWSLWLYNGNGGGVYNSFAFDSWSTIDSNTGVGVHTIKTIGLQNGSPDGLVLFDGVNVIQFVSYEGSFTATSGVAKGLNSIDIGVSESSDTPSDFSLQLTGKGSHYGDFTWALAQANSFGAINKDQEIMAQVNEPNNLFIFFILLFLFMNLSKHQLIVPLLYTGKYSW